MEWTHDWTPTRRYALRRMDVRNPGQSELTHERDLVLFYVKIPGLLIIIKSILVIRKEKRMAYIRQIEHSEATGELKTFYDDLAEIAGGVPNVVKLAGLKLPAMKAAQDLYQSVLYHDSGLTMAQKEMVSTVVSVINGCDY